MPICTKSQSSEHICLTLVEKSKEEQEGSQVLKADFDKDDNYYTLQVLHIIVSCIYACAAIASVGFILLKNTHKKLSIQGNLRRNNNFWTTTAVFERITTTLTSIPHKKCIRQTKKILALCTILINVTTHQTQYVMDLRNCLLFLYCSCCYKGWMLMYKHLIQEANEKNQFLEDKMQSLPNSHVPTKFLRLGTIDHFLSNAKIMGLYHYDQNNLSLRTKGIYFGYRIYMYFEIDISPLNLMV